MSQCMQWQTVFRRSRSKSEHLLPNTTRNQDQLVVSPWLSRLSSPKPYMNLHHLLQFIHSTYCLCCCQRCSPPRLRRSSTSLFFKFLPTDFSPPTVVDFSSNQKTEHMFGAACFFLVLCRQEQPAERHLWRGALYRVRPQRHDA